MTTRVFDVFQLCALTVFLSLFIGRTLHLYVMRGVRVLTLGQGKPPAQAALEYLLVVLLPLWAVEIVAHAWPLPFHLVPHTLNPILIESPVWKLLGAVMIAAGVTLFALALLAFGDSWRVGIDRESPGVLVADGVFARSRNPIFVCMDLYAIGTFLITGRLFFLGIALVTLMGIHYQILQEEAFLDRVYGGAYREYRARVGRYWSWG